MNKTQNHLVTAAIAIVLGTAMVGCKKQELPSEKVAESNVDKAFISAEKLPKIYKFITISFGVPAEKISYDRAENIIHYDDMQMPASELENIYDNANEYKFNNEK